MSDSTIGIGHGLPEEGAILNGNLVPHRYTRQRLTDGTYKAPLHPNVEAKVSEMLRHYSRPTPSYVRTAPKQRHSSGGWT